MKPAVFFCISFENPVTFGEQKGNFFSVCFSADLGLTFCNVEGEHKATCDPAANCQGSLAFGNLLNLGLLKGIKMLFDNYDLCITSLHLRTSRRKPIVTPKYNLELFHIHDTV